jgi:hypothetical protein
VRLGCHETSLNYRELERAQRRIAKDITPIETLYFVFSNMSKLRNVIIADWLALALPGKSIQCCVQRLFGNTLPPETLNSTVCNSGEGVFHWRRAIKHFGKIAVTHPSFAVRSLRIGTRRQHRKRGLLSKSMLLLCHVFFVICDASSSTSGNQETKAPGIIPISCSTAHYSPIFTWRAS